MLPDRVSNPGPLTYESGALPIALRGPAGGGIKIPVVSRDRRTEYNEFKASKLMKIYTFSKRNILDKVVNFTR